MDKAELRRQLRDLLRGLSPDRKGHKSRQACQRLASCRPFEQASVVMMFLSMPDEIDTTEAISLAWQRGMTVVVPRVDWGLHAMTPVALESLDMDVLVSRQGLRNPAAGRPVDPERIDLVVTPGLGFDRQGHRLGRGAGFYDRFLSKQDLRATRCGFCFCEQVVESIPVTEADLPVDWLVTDEQALCIEGWKGV
jgi:5-formyltetrahydrofolate cyclo-ligase